jgi:hypothetical protein
MSIRAAAGLVTGNASPCRFTTCFPHPSPFIALSSEKTQKDGVAPQGSEDALRARDDNPVVSQLSIFPGY